MTYLSNAGTFLVQLATTLYITIVMVRFLLQLVKADFYNPVSQFVVKATTPLLKPLRRVIPGFAGIDFASVVLMLLLQFAALWAITAMLGVPAGIANLLMLSVAELIDLALNILLFSIIVQVIASWIAPGGYNPLLRLLYQLNDPLLRPARRLLPDLGGLDLSPILVLVGLQLVRMLVVAPIRDLAGGQFLL